MAIRINRAPRFTAPVDLMRQVDGKEITESFEVTFEILPDEEFDSFETRGAEGQKDLLRRILVDVNGVLDDDDKPMSFSHEMLDRLIGWPDLRLVLFRAFNRGLHQAAAGNFAGPGALGRLAN